MDFYPANIKIDLEFDKIEELVFNYCLSDWTKEISFPLPIFIDKNEIERSLAEVDEAKISFAKAIPCRCYHSRISMISSVC